MHKLTLSLLAAALLAPAALSQFTLVAPNGSGNVEGNSNNIYPWGNSGSSMRVQYVYDSATFTAQGVTTPVTISRLRFRADGVWATNWTGGTYPQVRIDMSTCPVDHLAVSGTFASNHGANLTTVLNGPVSIQAGTGSNPGPWYIDIPLTTPFSYNPIMGDDLTLDIQLNVTGWTGGATGTAPFDCVSGASTVPPPLGSRIFDDTSGTANGATGSVENDYAAVCEFTYAPATGLWPSFSATPTGGTSPLTVQFTDLTYTTDPGGVQAWQWDFDGDSIIDSTQRNPSFVYTGCGDFNVSLTAIDASHPAATFTRNAMIRTDLLQASFTKSSLGGGLYQFTDTTTPAAQAWAWDFDGDSIIDSTQQNPVWAYPLNCRNNAVTLTATLHCRSSSASDSVFLAAASLTGVPFTGGSGTSSSTVVGNMFDIRVTAPDGISICALTQAIWNYTGPFHADIYITPGSYVGKDANASAWRLVASGNGVATPGTASVPSHDNILLANSFYLPAGDYGVVVFLSAQPSGLMFVAYTAGPQGPFSNADLTINPSPVAAGGIVKYNLFGTGSFSPRCWNGTFHYTKVSLTGTGGYGFFGAGCASGLGITNLSANAAPRLGQTLAVTGNNVPSNVAFGLFGFSNTTSTLGTLPIDLTALGAPGCFGRVSVDVTAVLVGTGNAVTWTLPIPTLPGLLGLRAYQQLLVLDPPANGLGAVASDAAGLVIGG